MPKPAITPSAGELGAVSGLPLCASIVEQQAALYGQGCRATGEVKDVRTSITFLAPSEAVQWMSVRAEALRTAAQGKALTADDLYQAAMRLQNGATPVRAALINGFGEGTEEAVQAILEPASHGWSATLPEIFESYLSGAVMGAGMTVGSRLGRTDQDTA